METPTPVEFNYDNVGNRISMQDELGTLTYHYDQLSRMTAETRSFTEITSRSFQISYTYTLSGQLKTITDPFNAVVSYNYNKNAALTGVNGTGYDMSSPFFSNIQYRAWGAIKKANYGYGGELNLTYDTRLRPIQYAVTGTAYGSSYTRGSAYTYYADGQLKSAAALGGNSPFDKSYKYDQVGRFKEALSEPEARGEPVPPNTNPNRPYKQSYIYDVWDNRAGGEQRFWRRDLSDQVQNTYVNNRIARGVWANQQTSYDADGREMTMPFDAAGRNTKLISDVLVGGYPSNLPAEPLFEITQVFDGTGAIGKRREIKRKEETVNGQMSVETSDGTIYYVRSSVLGGKPIVELNQQGNKIEGLIYAAGALLAKERKICQGCTQNGLWLEANPLTGSRYEVDGNGGAYQEERDPMGTNTGLEDPWLYEDEPDYFDVARFNQELFLEAEAGMNPFDPRHPCELNGTPYSCERLERDAENGNVAADIYRGGRLIGRNALVSGITSGGTAIISTAGAEWYNWERLKDGNGDLIWQPVPTAAPGNDYFTDVAVNSAQQTCPWCLPTVPNVKERHTENPRIKYFRTPQEMSCDNRLARIFGDDDAVMATDVEPPVLNEFGGREPQRLRTDSAGERPSQGITHLFANLDGTGVNKGNAFTPPGYVDTNASPYFKDHPGRESGKELQNYRWFYYAAGSLTIIWLLWCSYCQFHAHRTNKSCWDAG